MNPRTTKYLKTTIALTNESIPKISLQYNQFLSQWLCPGSFFIYIDVENFPDIAAILRSQTISIEFHFSFSISYVVASHTEKIKLSTGKTLYQLYYQNFVLVQFSFMYTIFCLLTHYIHDLYSFIQFCINLQ